MKTVDTTSSLLSAIRRRTKRINSPYTEHVTGATELRRGRHAGRRNRPGWPRTSRRCGTCSRTATSRDHRGRHSYGGIETAEAAGIASVRHLLLIASYMPEVGQNLSEFGDGAPAPFLDVDPASGTFTERTW
jgi:hypothetical protein